MEFGVQATGVCYECHGGWMALVFSCGGVMIINCPWHVHGVLR
jgi:hypothetical protein